MVTINTTNKTELRSNIMLVSVDAMRFLILVYFVCLLESADRDFTVKYKGEVLSLKKLLGLLSDYNISVPQNEDSFFNEVINKQTSSRIQSCNGRSFKDERTVSKTCYCDKACITWGDCCLDFHLR